MSFDVIIGNYSNDDDKKKSRVAYATAPCYPGAPLWESESEVGGEAHALKGSSKESYSLVRHVRKTNEVQQIKAHEELMFAKSTDNDESVI